MSSDHEKQSGSSSVWLGIIVGAVLMVGGAWFSSNVHLDFFHQLEEQGIPLDPGETIATIGVLLILFPIIRFFFLAPLQAAIQERNSNLEQTFSEAESLRAEMQKMRTEYEARLAATEANAREQIQAQVREAQNLGQTLRAEASQRAEQLLAQAQQQIEQEKAQALTEIRVAVVDLTLAATEKVLGENVDSDRNRQLVNDFIDKVEVAS